MSLIKFDPQPGIYNDGTQYAAKGLWHVCDKIRFRDGKPQKINGWINSSGNTAFIGTCRFMHTWADLAGTPQLFFSTNAKAYILVNGVLTDATPFRITGTLTNPFATANASNVITVTSTAHGCAVGDYVNFSGATGTLGGVNLVNLNGNWAVTSITANTFTFVGPTVATSGASGGGGTVTYGYEFSPGPVDRVSGSGYGGGAYGSGSWSGIGTGTSLGPQPRMWSGDNFGQDFVGCWRGGGIYYYTGDSAARMFNISTLSGASNVPTIANHILVAPQSRQVFAFGCDVIGNTGVLDPMYVRWSDLESAAQWTPSTTNAAGGFRLSTGSQIYCARRGPGNILVWTESSLYALNFVGGATGWGQQLLSPNIDIIGPNAVATFGNFAMWMGRENFYLYDGTVKTMPCTIRELVFGSINLIQGWKTYVATNSLNREVWFFYTSNNSTECDSYVIYNYVEDVWSYGTMRRTAWADNGVFDYPQGASTDGFIYSHEVGLDDGSTSPATPIDAYVESGPIEIADGDHFVFLKRIIPDITFVESSTGYPSVTMTITPRDYPGGPYYNSGALPVTKVTSMTVEQFTQKLDLRVRGRYVILRIESNALLGVWWRIGSNRLDIQPDGMR